MKSKPVKKNFHYFNRKEEKEELLGNEIINKNEYEKTQKDEEFDSIHMNEIPGKVPESAFSNLNTNIINKSNISYQKINYFITKIYRKRIMKYQNLIQWLIKGLLKKKQRKYFNSSQENNYKIDSNIEGFKFSDNEYSNINKKFSINQNQNQNVYEKSNDHKQIQQELINTKSIDQTNHNLAEIEIRKQNAFKYQLRKEYLDQITEYNQKKIREVYLNK